MCSSIKLCLLAEGKVQIYPRSGPTLELDKVVAHAVVNVASGELVNHEDFRIIYKESFLNPNQQS